MNIIRLLLPLSSKKKTDLENISQYLDPEDAKKVKNFLKLGKIGVSYKSLKLTILKDTEFPYLDPAQEDPEVLSTIKTYNDVIEQSVREKKYLEFAPTAHEKIIEFIAPHIVGMDFVKEAAMIQLFSKEKIHVLLLGDPGTGKTDILRAVSDLAPISSFGLGSGTSAVGLTAAIKGKEVVKGLLPMADNGICCVDELNLMKSRDRGSLLNAMEKGFVTYDKGSKHVKFDARISLLATANPKGDKFVGRTPDTWLQQIPFDTALLTRFHLVFFIRKPTDVEFINIAKKIASDRKKNLDLNDSLFIRDFIEYSLMLDVAFDEKLKSRVVDFAAKLKKDEEDFLVDISPRIVLGVIRFAKAYARINHRNKIEESDLKKVFKIFENSLYVKNQDKKRSKQTLSKNKSKLKKSSQKKTKEKVKQGDKK